MEGYIKLVFFFYAEDLLTFVYMYKCVCKQKNKTNKKQKNRKQTLFNFFRHENIKAWTWTRPIRSLNDVMNPAPGFRLLCLLKLLCF